MTKQYKKEGENLIITIPMKTVRANPYDTRFRGKMDNIIGLYEKDYNNGLAYRIDMQYKGKDDQCTDYFYKLDGTLDEFNKMVEDLGIDAIYMNNGK